MPAVGILRSPADLIKDVPGVIIKHDNAQQLSGIVDGGGKPYNRRDKCFSFFVFRVRFDGRNVHHSFF